MSLTQREDYDSSEEFEDEIHELIHIMSEAVVDHPQDIKIRITHIATTTIYEIQTNPADVGQVVGTKGAHINAMRTLLMAACKKMNARKFVLDVVQHDR